MTEFEWDSTKAKSNLKRHGISFEEAKSVFFDDYALQFYDEGHSEEEDRFLLLGLSNTSKLLMIVHCEREGGNVIRIISARKATTNESAFYQGPKL